MKQKNQIINGHFQAKCEAGIEYDDCLRLDLDFAKKNANCAFSVLLNDIQNMIINCMIEDEIKVMIKNKSFVTVTFDKIMDLQMKS